MFAANFSLNAVTSTLRHRYPSWVNPYSRNAALLAVAATLCTGPVYGAQVPDTFDLSTLDGTTGFAIHGVAEDDYSGHSVSSAGDVNGDGVDDLIVGAYRADPNGIHSSGASYVVFGRRTGFAEAVELSDLNGTNGLVINGVAEYDYSGGSVSGAGDINGDGVDDLIIGAWQATRDDTPIGVSYVVFGRRAGFAATLELSALDGNTGFAINGVPGNFFSGWSVSDAGDVNGDGVDDLIIGAIGGSSNNNGFSGASYVVFGRGTGFAATLDLSTLDGTTGFAINGVATSDFSGISVSGAGDINGDGVDDLIIGAYGAPNGGYYGASYVVFGRPTGTGFPASLELSSLDGTTGFTINGVAGGDRSGSSVSGAGDVNGDGVDDLIIGATLATPQNVTRSGASYVVFGRRTGFAATLELSALDGITGFRINGAGEREHSGRSVSSAGDVNGDGLDDLIIGAWSADSIYRYTGASYVVFGRRTSFAAVVELSALDGTTGFRINGVAEVDYSGWSVSGAGDINGDGVDDLIIGAHGADPNGNSRSGASYVVFMPLADTAETTTPQMTTGSTVFANIAPLGDTDKFEFVVLADPINAKARDNAVTLDKVTSHQRSVIQTSNDGTEQHYDTKLSLYQIPSQINGCQSTSDDRLVATNDNIDTSPDRAYSQLAVELPCGRYRIEVESAETDRVIPSYALSLSAKPVKILPSHRWQLISLPDEGGSSDDMTLEAIFGDELDPADYFNPPPISTKPTWAAYAYDEIGGDYVPLALSDSLNAHDAYWIIQETGTPVSLDTPATFAPPLPLLVSGGLCSSANRGCFIVPLTATSGATVQWNTLGSPGYASPRVSSITYSNGDSCIQGCDLDTAFNDSLLWNSFYRYDGEKYLRVGGYTVNGIPPVGDTWHPWDGFWGAVLPGSVNTNPELVIPVD